METEQENHLILDMPILMGSCGPDGCLRTHIWFDYLQHLAAVHAEKLGFGMTAIKENGLIWILSRLKLHLDSAPRYDDVLRIETYHNGMEKIFAKRQFVLSSAVTGQRFGYASSFWLCLKLPNLRPCSPASALNFSYDVNLDRKDFFPILEKLPPLTDGGDPVSHLIGSTHIDLNDHMNNTFYCEYAMDWLSRKTGKLIRLEEIQVNYNRAMMLGEELIVTGRIDGDHFVVEGVEKAGGKNSFQAQGIWRSIGE